MPYSTSNPPALVTQRVGGGGAVFSYDSTDAATAVRVDGYINNGQDLGMKIGDTVKQFDSVGGSISHEYTVVSLSTVDRSVDLSDGVSAPVTDTD